MKKISLPSTALVVLAGFAASQVAGCKPSAVPCTSPPDAGDPTIVVVTASDAGDEFQDFSADAGIFDADGAACPAEVGIEDAGALLEASTPCDGMYAVLVRFRCQEARTITPRGERPETFVQLCKRAIQSGHPMPTTCVAAARTKAAVQRCGVLCDPPRTR